MKYLILLLALLLAASSFGAKLDYENYEEIILGNKDDLSKKITLNGTPSSTNAELEYLMGLFYINKDITIGASAVSDTYIRFNRGDGNFKPYLKWDEATDKIRFSNNGVDESDLGSGGGGSTTLSGLTDTTITSVATGEYLKWDGSAWVNSAVGPGQKYNSTEWAQFTVQPKGFGTVNSNTGWWKREGDTMIVKGFWQSGTTSGAIEAQIALPSGYEVDTAKLVSASRNLLGYAYYIESVNAYDSTTHEFAIFSDGSDLDDVFVSHKSTGDTAFLKSFGNQIAASSKSIAFYFEVPIKDWEVYSATAGSVDVDEISITTNDNGQLQVNDTILNNIMVNAFRIAINGSLPIYYLSNSIMDEFVDTTGVSVSTNATHNPTSDSWTNQSDTYSSALTGSGTAGGTVTNASNAFDNAAGTYAFGALAVTGKYVQYDFGSGNSEPVRRIDLRQGANLGASYMISSNGISVDYSDNCSSWTTGETINPTTSDTTTQTFDISDYGSRRCWRLRALGTPQGGGAFEWEITEVEFYKLLAANADLQSVTLTASTSPSKSRIVLFAETDGVLNDSLVAQGSRDDGTTWSDFDLKLDTAYDGNKYIIHGLNDYTGDPSGTDVKWRVTTNSSISLTLHGVGLSWD